MKWKQLVSALAAVGTLLACPVRADQWDSPYEPQWEGPHGLMGGGSLPEQAMAKEAGGHYKAAAAIYQRMFERAKVDLNKARSLQKQADCLSAARKYYQADKAYRKLLETYPAYVTIEPVLENLRELAMKFAGGEASIFKFKNTSLAIEVYQFILKVAPAGKKAPTDMVALAQLQTEAEQWDEAVKTNRDLARMFPKTPEAAEAHLLSARLLLKSAAAGDGDGRYIRQAQRELKLFINDYPSHPQVKDAKLLTTFVEEAQGQRLVELAKFYLRPYSYRPEAARRYLHDVIRAYPDTTASVMANLLLAKVEKMPPAKPADRPGTEATATSSAGTPPPAAASAAVTPPMSERVPEAAPAKPVLPPAKLLQQKENVSKWLLPLEDYNDTLQK